MATIVLSILIASLAYTGTLFGLHGSFRANAAVFNTIPNPSFENGSITPNNWYSDKSGSNYADFIYNTNLGHDGNRSATIKITHYNSGNAKWYFSPISVKPGTYYKFSDFYISNVISQVEAVIKTKNGSEVDVLLGNQPASTKWNQAQTTFKTPADAVSLTVYHYIAKVGELTTDDFTISVVPLPQPKPIIPTTTTVTVANPQSTLTTSATIPKLVPKAPPIVVPSPTKLPVPNNPTPAPLSTPPPAVPPPSTAIVNLIKNPSVENNSSGIPTAWSSDGWGTNTHQTTYESVGHTGSYSLKTTMTAYTNGDAKWYFDPVAVTPGASYNYSEYYISNSDGQIDILVNMAGGVSNYYYLTNALASPNNWQKVSAQFVMPAGAVSATVFHTLAKVGFIQSDDFTFGSYTPAQYNRALISLTFDDGYKSIYNNGLPELKKYGMVSTQYLLTGTTTYPDYMTIAMMQEFKNQGSEIAGHTITHANLTTLTFAQLTSELADSQAQLRTWFGSNAAKNFATPYGAYNSTVISEIKKYYRSHRSVEEGYNTKDNFNIYDIRVHNMLNTTTPAQVQTWVNQAIATKSWLVLVFHEIGSGTDPTYSTSTTNLDLELNNIKQSGIVVKTVDQALDEIIVQ